MSTTKPYTETQPIPLTLTFRYNVFEGTILVTDAVSPQGALNGANAANFAEGQPPKQPKPPLEFWSDVTYLQWEKLCEQNLQYVKGLHRIVQCNITNQPTIEVIKHLYGEASTAYPGKTFLPGSSEFSTLLGTANGQGVGQLLSQHKDNSQLGPKSFEKVQVFEGGGANKWFMVFEF